MSNEFPKFSEVFALDKSVTYNETITQVWYPQDNAILSVPSVSPIETVLLENNKIVPTVALLQISYDTTSDKILNFIDYSNLRDGAIIQLRIKDDTFPITIKNNIVGDGSIMTADGNDIILNDYRKIVQFQREGTLWRQVGGIQIQADNKTIARTEDNTFEVFGIKDQGVDATAKKIWTGTREAFELLEEKADDVFYFVQDQGIYLGEKELSGGSGLEIGDIGIAPLGVDESQGKRRYLNGQVIIQEHFVTFTEKLKSAVELYPTLACSENDWQATSLLTVGGQCGKFVIDNEAGTIRLPKIIMPIQGLTDLGKLAEIVNAGLPNITATFSSWTNAQLQSGATIVTGSQNANTGSGNYSIDQHYSFDASRSSSVYGNSNTVQPEAVQYPYFIQVATGVEESVDVTREIELNNPFSLLDYKWSEYELNNASWLLSNGAFHSGATYVSVYELLLKIQNGTEIKDGVSVKLSTEAYEDTDFVLNTADTTFRLPIKVKLASGNAVIGNGMTLGLTNGTSTYGLGNGGDGLQIREDQYGTNVGTNAGGADPITETIGIITDPLKSGIETSSSGLKLYFYVGETIQDANIINASGVLTRVAELSNSYISGLGMPDYSAGVGKAANTQFTAESDGFLLYNYSGATSTNTLTINGISINLTTQAQYSHGVALMLPIPQGTTYKLTGGGNKLIFYPLKGVN